MNKFILEIQNALSSEFCKEVIYKFERDLRKCPGQTIGGINTNVKKSTDLVLNNKPGWNEIETIFCNSLKKSVIEYRNYIGENFPRNPTLLNLVDTGFQIQRSVGGEGFYDWHHDFFANEIDGVRILTFIWYLNTIVGPGGETEFIDGTKITPEEGKLIFFPATWTFLHRGVMPPKGTVKYLCTGWLYTNDW